MAHETGGARTPSEAVTALTSNLTVRIRKAMVLAIGLRWYCWLCWGSLRGVGVEGRTRSQPRL